MNVRSLLTSRVVLHRIDDLEIGKATLTQLGNVLHRIDDLETNQILLTRHDSVLHRIDDLEKIWQGFTD